VGTWEFAKATPPIFNYKCCYHKRPLRCFISNLPIVHLKEMSYVREFMFYFVKTSPLCWSLMPNLLQFTMCWSLMPNLLQFTMHHAYTLFLLMALLCEWRWTSRLAWDFVCNCVHKAGYGAGLLDSLGILSVTAFTRLDQKWIRIPSVYLTIKPVFNLLNNSNANNNFNSIPSILCRGISS
jgi:hypothetical protein